jgi:hypothetical protein
MRFADELKTPTREVYCDDVVIPDYPGTQRLSSAHSNANQAIQARFVQRRPNGSAELATGLVVVGAAISADVDAPTEQKHCASMQRKPSTFGPWKSDSDRTIWYDRQQNACPAAQGNRSP